MEVAPPPKKLYCRKHFKQALAVIADIWSLYATTEVKVYSTNKLSKV